MDDPHRDSALVASKLDVISIQVPKKKLRPTRWSTTIPWQAFEIAPSFTPEEWFIYTMLLNRGDHNGHSFPSIDRLMRDTGMKRTAVKNALRGLKSKRRIEIQHRKGQVSYYFVLLRHEKHQTPSS